jgi:hypothetical protein
MANKNILKMPDEYFQNVNNDEDLLTSEEENARREVADYMENHYMEECRDDYNNNSSTSKKEEEKNDPFMTGLAVVCSAALISSIVGGISTFFTNRKVNKFLKEQKNN